MISQQLWLGGRGEPSIDRRFSTARRVELGRGAWIEHVHDWVGGHDVLFAELEGSVRWRAESRSMYERIVEVPRLLAFLPEDGPAHPLVAEMADALGDRYGAHLDSIMMALYRHGQDSVAWHRDHEHRDRERSIVAVASLGGARRFLVRPFGGGGTSAVFTVSGGDLLVMGGSCQRTVEHCVPKTRHADPRIAVMFRHTAPIAPHVR